MVSSRAFALALLPVALGITALLSLRPCRDFTQATVRLPARSIAVGLAVTKAEQQRGLAGCRRVPRDHGLYFTFVAAAPRTFWMRGMLMPIDLVWINQGLVVGLEENIPPPALGTTYEQLARFHSPQPVDGVLELAAGAAHRLGLTQGTSLVLELDSPPASAY